MKWFRSQALLTTLSTALFYSLEPVNYDTATASQHEQTSEPETEADQ